MWMRCWFALIFSLILTLYCQYSHAEQTVDDVLGPVHDVGVSGVGAGRQGVSGGSGSAFSKRGACSIRCNGSSCQGIVTGGGGGGGQVGGAVGNAGAVNPGALGATASNPPAPKPPAPTEPPETFPEKPSLIDVQGFLTKRCTSCHTMSAELLDPDKIRIKKGNGSPMTFAEAFTAMGKIPAMAKIMANPNVAKAFETWKKLP